MALRSVLNIDVNDVNFQRFYRVFQQYQQQAAKTPAGFAGAQQAAQGTALTFERMAVLLAAQTEITSQILSHYSQQNTQVQRQVTLWDRLTRHAKDFTRSVDRATLGIVRWGTVGTLATGLAGLGGLFGLDRMAGTVGALRRQSMGLGFDFGTMRSFGLNFGRIVDPGAFLGGISEARGDPAKSWVLQTLGVSGKDPLDVLSRVRRLAQQTPESLLGPMLVQGRGLGNLGFGIEELRRLKEMTEEEYKYLVERHKMDRDRLKLDKDQQLALANLNRGLTASGQIIETAFWRKLAAIAPNLIELSDRIAKRVADWIDQITPQQIEQWINWISRLFGALKGLGDWLIGWFGPAESKEGGGGGTTPPGKKKPFWRFLLPETFGAPPKPGDPEPGSYWKHLNPFNWHLEWGDPGSASPSKPSITPPSSSPPKGGGGGSFWKHLNPFNWHLEWGNPDETGPKSTPSGPRRQSSGGFGLDPSQAVFRQPNMSPGRGGDAASQFISAHWQEALEVSRVTGVDPMLVLAQAAHESAWGTSAPGNNLFGIKGRGQSQSTLEYIPGRGMVRVSQQFAGYRSSEESFAAYAAMLKRVPNYRRVLEAKTLEEQIREMGRSGYATDPDYERKLRRMVESVRRRMQTTGQPHNQLDQMPQQQQLPHPKRRAPIIEVRNRTGGNAYVATSQLAV